MKMTLKDKYELTTLIIRWNEATCPWRLRSDHEHLRNRQLARAIRNRMRRIGAIEDKDYFEDDNGRLALRRIGPRA